MKRAQGINWPGIIPFVAVHLVGFATPFLVAPTWGLAALAVGVYYVRMFGITAGYHRYFSHRAYRTSRAFQFALAWLGATASQKGALWWAAHHRDHHRYSDTEDDIHSPLVGGFVWSHVGWIVDRGYEGTNYDRVKDLAKYPELMWIERHWWVPPATLAVGLFLAGGWAWVLWGFFLSTTVLWHGTFVINSLAHVIGSRRYETTDGSRNSFVLALVTMGEGWHNNHHFYPGTANQGFFWWEWDPSYYVLRGLAALGLVWDLRTPPLKVKFAHLDGDRARQVRPAIDAAG
ncbi:MAG: acyl-CoA desaturase [Anaeromyxobacter sp.]|mgnify:CR=1 FL=1